MRPLGNVFFHLPASFGKTERNTAAAAAGKGIIDLLQPRTAHYCIGHGLFLPVGIIPFNDRVPRPLRAVRGRTAPHGEVCRHRYPSLQTLEMRRLCRSRGLHPPPARAGRVERGPGALVHQGVRGMRPLRQGMPSFRDLNTPRHVIGLL